MSTTASIAATHRGLQQDSGLRCPACEYNLTGLATPRCPECGVSFDWETVRRASVSRPTIAFERARGKGKVLGFAVTWLAVLFAPWVFARQVVLRVDARHALAFVGVCLASTVLSFFFHNDVEVWGAWVTTAVIYIVGQALWLSVLDPRARREPVRTFRFWFCIGCYTSAVMMTEFVTGPPIVGVKPVVDWLGDVLAGTADWPGVGMPNDRVLVSILQMVSWLTAVGCCYVARLRTTRKPAALVVALTLFALLGVFALYGTSVEYIGMPLWHAFGGSIF